MPSPTMRDLHLVNEVLTNVSIAYTQDREGLIANKICPWIPVNAETGTYPIWTKADFLRIQAQQIAPGASTPEAVSALSSGTYRTYNYGLKKLVTNKQRANQSKGVNIDKATTMFLTEQVLMKREQVVLATALASGSWSTTYTGVAAGPTGAQFLQWNDSSSIPFKNIRTINRVLKGQCGRRANTLVVTSDVDDILKEHDDILDKVKHTQTGIVTDELLAKAFGVKNYLVSDAIYNSAAEGQSASMSFMATKCGLLLYVAENPSLEEPSACYNMGWSEFDGLNNGDAPVITSWENKDPAGEYFRSALDFAPTVTASDAGIYLSAVIA